MAKYVLAADYTLMTDYRGVPLATFFSCIPTDYWHSRLVYRILADPPKLDANGQPIRAPYGLRKVEESGFLNPFVFARDTPMTAGRLRSPPPQAAQSRKPPRSMSPRRIRNI